MHHKCPEHQGETLKIKTIFVKYPSQPLGEPIIMDYCPKSNKYLYGGKLVSLGEAALKSINTSIQSFNPQHINLKLEDIQVKENISKLLKNI